MITTLQRYHRELFLVLLSLLGLSLGKLAAGGLGIMLLPPIAPQRGAEAPAAQVEKRMALTDYENILQRNIFDSSGSAQSFQSTSAPARASDVSSAPRSSLVLVGTVAGKGTSLALIRVGQEIKSFHLGDSLPGGGKLEEIAQDSISIRNPDGSLETLPLFLPGEKQASAPPTAAPAARNSAGEYQIRPAGENQWVIPREDAEKARQNIGELLKQARMEPRVVDGKTSGFVVKMIRPNSILSQMGLQLGDVVVEVNGVTLDSPEKALQIFQQLREAKNITVGLERSGQPMSFTYEVN